MLRGAASTFIPAADPRVTVEGRTAPAPGGALRVGYPGVVFRFRTAAPRVVARLTASSADVYVDVSVDGAPPRRVRLAKGLQELVRYDGPAGPHVLALLKRTESWQGTIELVGFETRGGPSAVEPVPLPARQLLFVSDSIVCGASSASSDVPDATSTETGAQTNDGGNSFGRVLAARLGAACHPVGYGGRGITRDWQGIRDTVPPRRSRPPTATPRAPPTSACATCTAA